MKKSQNFDNKGDINGDGTVKYIMIQGDPENIDAQYRTEYSVKALTEKSGLKADELLIQRGDWDQAKGTADCTGRTYTVWKRHRSYLL